MIVAMYFLTLKDTPGSYVDQANKVPAVNAGESGLEFISPYSGYGLATNIGTAGIKGRFYFATDTGILYEDDGTAWVEITRSEAKIRLAQLSEKAHASLTGVTADQHHAELHAIDSVLVHSGVITDTQHGVRTLANAHAHGHISGVTSDQHHAKDHGERHEDDGDDPVTPLIHHLRHETGGLDEVAGLVFPLKMIDPGEWIMTTSEGPFDWTDIDVSAYTTPDVAKAVLLQISTNLNLYYSGNYGKFAASEARFRKKGGTSEGSSPLAKAYTGVVTADYYEYARASGFVICEVDGDEIFQVKLLDVGSKVWTVLGFNISLIGYFK